MNKTLTVALILVLGAAGLLAERTANAHHSAALFDMSKKVALAGTVKRFQWTSPHCWIQLLVADAAQPSSAPVEWGIEMDNPLGLLRHGWKVTSLKPGDKIVVIAHPLRDGSHGGRVVSVTRADGTRIGH